MVYSIFNPGGFWFESQVKMLWRIKAWMRAWMKLRHLTSRLRKITKHKSNLQSSVFCLNKTKITYSTGNDFSMVNPGGFWFEAQIKMLSCMKDKSLNIPATLDIPNQKIHKTQNSSSIVCFLLESNKNSTFNWKWVFNGQSRWILIWSTSKNVMKEKSLNAGLNVPATLDIAPHKNHNTQISSSIVCFLLDSKKNYTFNWKLLLLWSIQKDFDLKYK